MRSDFSSRHVFEFMHRYGLPLTLVVMIAVFGVLNPGFISLASAANLVNQNAALALVAVGLTFVLIAGSIDLSVGSMLALVGVVIALVAQASGDIVSAAALGLIAALIVGVLNGALVSLLRLNSVIVTLAAFIWARGLATALTEGSSVPVTGWLPSVMNARLPHPLSVPFIIAVGVYVVGHVLLTRTQFGRHVFAVGGDERSARQVGIRLDAVRLKVFALSAGCAGLAGLVEIGRLAAAQPNAGFGLELDAIAAVIIGGTKLNGGEGSLRRTLVGVLFIAVLNTGLASVGIRDAYLLLYKGLVILFALSLEVVSERLTARSARREMVTTPEVSA